MQQLAKQQNGFDSVVSGIIGPHIKKGKGSDWFRDKEPVDPDAVYVAFITSMMIGGINWGEESETEKPKKRPSTGELINDEIPF